MFNLEKVEIMKKVFYKSLILAFSATMLSANVNAQFAGGTGTESDPYIIQTAESIREVFKQRRVLSDLQRLENK